MGKRGKANTRVQPTCSPPERDRAPAEFISFAHRKFVGDIEEAAKRLDPQSFFSAKDALSENWLQALDDSAQEWAVGTCPPWHNCGIAEILNSCRPRDGKPSALPLTLWFVVLRLRHPSIGGEARYMGFYNCSPDPREWLKAMMPFLPDPSVESFCSNRKDVVQDMQGGFTVLKWAIDGPSATGHGCTVEAFRRFDDQSEAAFLTFPDNEYREGTSRARDFDKRIGMRSVGYFRTEDPDILLVASSPIRDHFGILESFFKALANETKLYRGNVAPYLLACRADCVKTNVQAFWPASVEHPPPKTRGLKDIVGRSPAIANVKKLIEKYARTDGPVHITGDTGVGKDLVAEAIHSSSNRARGPFIHINCAQMPKNLLTEMLGYPAGGAMEAANPEGKQSWFEMADGGTLFLNEIGELQSEVQRALNDIVDKKRVKRLNAEEWVNVDFRLITATLRNLEVLPTFHKDVFRRLSTHTINVPLLRDRREDIALLAEHLISQVLDPQNRSLNLTRDTITALAKHDWPQNVGELRNWLQDASALAEGTSDIERNENFNEILRKKVEDRPNRTVGAEEPSTVPVAAASPTPPLSSDLAGTPASVGPEFDTSDLHALTKGKHDDVVRITFESAFPVGQELTEFEVGAIVRQLSNVAEAAKNYISRDTPKPRWRAAVALGWTARLRQGGLTDSDAETIAKKVCIKVGWHLTKWK